MPEKKLCKFMQSNNIETRVWTYMIFHLQLALHDTSSQNIPIYSDTPHSDWIKHICKCGEKTVLTKKSEIEVDPDVAKVTTGLS